VDLVALCVVDVRHQRDLLGGRLPTQAVGARRQARSWNDASAHASYARDAASAAVATSSGEADPMRPSSAPVAGSTTAAWATGSSDPLP
jgi:hypothetical protein